MKYYALLIACVIYNLANAQECTSKLSGKVNDFHDGSNIIGAILHIKELDIYTTTDLDGGFVFQNLCDGKITVTISHVGCDTKELDVVIKGDTQFKINLEHHIEQLNEVTVNGHLVGKQSKTSQETLLKTKDLELFSSGSLGDVLKKVSGVSSLNTGSTIVKPVINGLHSSRVIVMTNGVRLQDQEWGVEHAPNIDINASGSISVIKGSGALAYGGDAIGGVVVLNSSPTILKDSLYGKTIVSGQTNGRGFSLSSSLYKTYATGWYINGQATTKYYGDFKAADYSLTNTGLKSNGFSIHTGYKSFEKGFNIYYSYLNNEIAILESSHIGNAEDLINAINTQQPLVIDDFSYNIGFPKQDVTHQLIKADFYKRFKKFGKLKVQYDFQNNQRYEYDLRIGEDRFKPAIDLTLKTHSIKTDLKLDSNIGNTYEIGLSGSSQNNFANPDTGVRRLIPDYDKYDFGVFLLSDFTLNKNVFLDFGVRYDFNKYDAKKFYKISRWEELGYDADFSNLIIDEQSTQYLTNPIFEYHNISASAGVAYNLNTNSKLIANYSLSSRAPNPSELFSDGLHHSAARIELGDLRISQEKSNRVSASYIYNTSVLNLSFETFYNHIDNYILIEPTDTEQTIRGEFLVWEYKQTNASLFGVDLDVHYQYNKHWFASNKSSIVKGHDISKDRPLIDMPSFKTVNALSYSNKKWWHFNSELQSELVLAQNEYPNNNFEVYIPTTDEFELLDISTPPPTYHLLHFNSDITLNISQKTNLNIGLRITNILNTSYREYLNRLRYFADDLGRNIMLQLKLNY
ncbi:TonB-dependent receptor [Flavivirga jejuensis]|uniref:TonB-dependent receptor n=1 Tax=Flavivirga jejuensis TaxID=870487 RepID=A0ABT8WPK4_9FLAO|nr:TonB-dependent receptor [Flavivirga jejuensis]MDO5974950.1 TonB-dependent receptor [Flavivirga jejuensis]